MSIVVENAIFESEDLSLRTAFEKVFTICRNHNKILMGAKEIIKTLVRSTAQDAPLKMVIIAKDADQQAQDIMLFKCREKNVPVIYVDTRKELGEMAPLKKVKNIGAVGIVDFIYETREQIFILSSLAK